MISECWFQCSKKFSLFHVTVPIIVVLLMWKSIVLFLKNFFFKVLGLSFSLKLDLGSHSVFIAEIASKKVETLICSMKFLPPKITLYLCKSNIMPSMEYFCHVELGASSSHLDILYKLQKWVWRTLGSLLATSFKPLAHHWNIGSIIISL